MKTITFKLPIFHISLNFHSTQTQNQQMGKPKVQNFKQKQAIYTGQWYELPEKKKNFLQKLSQTHYSKARPLHHHHLEPHVREQEHEGQESEEFQRLHVFFNFLYEGLDVEAKLSLRVSVTLLVLKHWQVTPHRHNISYI